MPFGHFLGREPPLVENPKRISPPLVAETWILIHIGLELASYPSHPVSINRHLTDSSDGHMGSTSGAPSPVACERHCVTTVFVVGISDASRCRLSRSPKICKVTVVGSRAHCALDT